MNNPDIGTQLPKRINPNEFLQLKSAIPKDMALLNYLITDKYLYIFCATTDSAFGKKIKINDNDLEEKVMLWYNLLRHPNFKVAPARGCGANQDTIYIQDYDKVFRETGNALFEILIEPVRKEIGPKRQLVIFPSQSLSFIPFATLIENPSGNEIKYLIESFEIIYSHDLLFLKTPNAEDVNIPLNDTNIIHYSTIGILTRNHSDTSSSEIILLEKDNNLWDNNLNDTENSDTR